MNDTREPVFSVSGLTSIIKETLETAFFSVAVEGEISNFRPYSSGHWYFSLKDEEAVISGVMFRHRAGTVRFKPADGQRVIVRGALSVYPRRGNYQIICESMVLAGEGDILALLEERKRRLAAEGLFDEDRKKAVPMFPSRVAVVTSPDGAAVRDILQVLGRRSAGIDVVILPAPVQGDEAAGKIAAQIRRANRYSLGDVIITGRGGGSLEDLLPFSDEAVVRAIAESDIPVISAVGHEIDFALSDFAADRRAPTPSAAAELVSSGREDLIRRIDTLQEGMGSILSGRLERIRLLLKRFTPDYLEDNFRRLVQPLAQQLDDGKEDLLNSIGDIIRDHRYKLTLLAQELTGNSPLEILKKGYAVVTRSEDGTLLTSAEKTNLEEKIRIRLAAGSLGAKVEEIIP